MIADLGTIMIPRIECPSWLPSWLCPQEEQTIEQKDLPGVFQPPPVPPIYGTGEHKGEPVIVDEDWQTAIDYVGRVPPRQPCDWQCWLEKNRLALMTVAGVIGVFLFLPASNGRKS